MNAENRRAMDQETIRELYEKYGHLIFGRCRRILGSDNEAADAMQTVFVKLMESYDSIRNKERVVPWIFTAATNHCFNLLRDRKKFDPRVDPDTLDNGEDAERSLSARQIVRLLMGPLGRKMQLAVYFTYVEELRQKEIQTVTGMSPATVRRYLGRFREYCAGFRQKPGAL